MPFPTPSNHVCNTQPCALHLPPIYSFPPFFTLQPHLPSRDRQMAAWTDLIRAYCAHHKLYRLDLNVSLSLDLFANAGINRSVSREMAAAIFRECVKSGLAEWSATGSKGGASDKSAVLVLWKSVAEWGNVLCEWAKRNGFTGSVVTGYEMRFGEYVTDEEFAEMDEQLFIRVVKDLTKQGKVSMINMAEKADELGFKFL
ncbi:ESCRT-II complex subunit-domain-containing protein [Catenaria anguillulae PL171]|uniref:ESCRT-II complex subunit-domain-containing protein n=1 Tax=Catenaria anguillulae PL171 TaxID=765915 RepID=A0A1Y2HK97_9FUNG|nr:ESCRT-II complex subunit-domain-containing protein [Catenaria anguillulae PL171]